MNPPVRVLVVLSGAAGSRTAAPWPYGRAQQLADADGAAWGVLHVRGPQAGRTEADAACAGAHRVGAAVFTCRAADDTPAAAADAALRWLDGRDVHTLLVGEGPHGDSPGALHEALRRRAARRRPRLRIEHWPATRRMAGTGDLGRTLRGAALVLAACLALSELLRDWLDPASVLLVYLAGVVHAAVRYGRAAALACVAGSVLLFDLLVVAPRWSLNPIEPRYFLTFGVMVAVGWRVSRLAADARDEALVAQARALRTQALNEVAGALAAARTPAAVGDALCHAVAARLGAAAGLMLPPGDGGAWQPAAGDAALASPRGLEAARSEARETGRGTVRCAELEARHLPLQVDGPVLAVLAVGSLPPGHDGSEDWHLLRSMAAQAATALERLRLEATAQAARLAGESERLRSTLLAGISHDFRTPLTTIIGAASSLLGQHAQLAPEVREGLLHGLLGEAQRMHRTLSDLLEVTRLEDGAVQPALEWCPADELVAEALDARAARLAGYRLVTDVPAALLVWCDPRLLGQLLGNLLDNAAEHTPCGTTVHLAMAREGDAVRLVVHDDGPGLPPGRESAVFGKFVRGHAEPARGGTGLGLAICAAVARLHGARLQAANDGGARFELVLPQPPGVLPSVEPA